MVQPISNAKWALSELITYFWMAVGAFFAAFALDVFFLPHRLIDGGIIGIAMICGNIWGKEWISLFLLLFNIPFLYMAYRFIGRGFLIHMLVANILFTGALFLIGNIFPVVFTGESLEVVVIGGAILGIGLGMIIRVGGCIDGTEILGIIVNRRLGLTVGQVVFFCNIFIFGGAGFLFQDWHPPLLSLIAFMVASKVMDAVIVGLEETKSVIIISRKSKQITEVVMEKLQLGLTVMYGRGGYSGVEQEILYVIVERLQLADLKEIIFHEDPVAFIAIENLHEVVNGMKGSGGGSPQKRIQNLVSKIMGTS